MITTAPWQRCMQSRSTTKATYRGGPFQGPRMGGLPSPLPCIMKGGGIPGAMPANGGGMPIGGAGGRGGGAPGGGRGACGACCGRVLQSTHRLVIQSSTRRLVIQSTSQSTAYKHHIQTTAHDRRTIVGKFGLAGLIILGASPTTTTMCSHPAPGSARPASWWGGGRCTTAPIACAIKASSTAARTAASKCFIRCDATVQG